MSVSIDSITPYSIMVSGNTMPYKEEFKKYGGTWNATLKAWRFPSAKSVEINELVQKINTNPSSVQSTVSNYKPYQSQNIPKIKSPNIGDIVIVSLNQMKLQVKVINIIDEIMEMETIENPQKLYATIILGKWRIYDHKMVNEVKF